jgi:hypothetical protein
MTDDGNNSETDELARECDFCESDCVGRLTTPSAAGTPIIIEACHECLKPELDMFLLTGLPKSAEMQFFKDCDRTKALWEVIQRDATRFTASARVNPK